jgi:hypothetical protein
MTRIFRGSYPTLIPFSGSLRRREESQDRRGITSPVSLKPLEQSAWVEVHTVALR